MTLLDKKERKVAQRLAALAIEHGDTGLADVVAAVKKLLESRSVTQQKRFIKTFLKALQREQQKSELCIEYVGRLSNDQVRSIESHFTRLLKRKLNLKTQELPELIGGLRVSVGDNVYDASISGQLAALVQSID